MGNEKSTERPAEDQFIGSTTEEGIFHGQGILRYAASDERKHYTGEWNQGKREGNGILEWENGAIYRGRWSNDQLEGAGFYLLPGNISYEGEFHHNCFHGSGVCSWLKDGRKYEGNWANNKPHGFGRLSFSPFDEQQRAYYKGEWSENQRHGYGIMKWNSGATYEGNWVNGKRHGQGKYTFSNGDVYVGNWANGKRNGPGIKYFSSGDRLDGNWVKDRKVGSAKYICSHGRVINQFYVHGRLSADPIAQEVPSLQVLCIEAIANNKALRQDRENLPAHLNDLISKREKAHPNTILCKIVDKLETLYNL